MDWQGWLLPLQAAATWYMTGVIWFVQIVHYPLFARVGTQGFATYERHNTRRTFWVVAPPMIVEFGCSVIAVARPPAGIPPWQTWVGLGLVGAIWASTAFQQVPEHRRLERGFDPDAHARLVRTNAVRTAAWTLRAALVAGWLL